MSAKDRILNTAERMFKCNGTRSVSMDDICKDLAISKKTIYQRFQTKKTLVKEVMHSVSRKRQSECELVLQNESNPIIASIKLIQLVVQSMKNTSPDLVYDLKKYYPESYHIMSDFKLGYMQENVNKCITGGIEMGLYREDINVPLVSGFYLSLYDELLAPANKENNKVEFSERVRQLLSYHLYGICTPKGIEVLENCKKDKELWP